MCVVNQLSMLRTIGRFIFLLLPWVVLWFFRGDIQVRGDKVILDGFTACTVLLFFVYLSILLLVSLYLRRKAYVDGFADAVRSTFASEEKEYL